MKRYIKSSSEKFSYQFDKEANQLIDQLRRENGEEWYSRFEQAAWDRMGKVDPYYLNKDEVKRLMNYVGAASDIPFDDFTDEDYAAFDQMEADQQAAMEEAQKLLDEYGGAIQIWYNENISGGSEGAYVSPGLDAEKAIRDAVNQTSSKDPNNFIIEQVDVLEGYYDPENGISEYDGTPSWSNNTPLARKLYYNLEWELKALRNEYAETSPIEESTTIEGGQPASHIQEHIGKRSKAKEFLERFDSDFLSDLEDAYHEYIHELSEYYDTREGGGYGNNSPTIYDWLGGLAEDYPDIPLEELEDAWKCIEDLDDSAMAAS